MPVHVRRGSPARLKDRALSLGLSPGLTADFITGWDFRSRTQRHTCAKKLAEEKPQFLVASPPCTAFSALQRISRVKRDPEKVILMEQTKEAEVHLDYSVGECERQKRQRRLLPLRAACFGDEVGTRSPWRS